MGLACSATVLYASAGASPGSTLTRRAVLASLHNPARICNPEQVASVAIHKEVKFRSQVMTQWWYSSHAAKNCQGSSAASHSGICPSGSVATREIRSLLSATHCIRSCIGALSRPYVVATWNATHGSASGVMNDGSLNWINDLPKSVSCGVRNAGIG